MAEGQSILVTGGAKTRRVDLSKNLSFNLGGPRRKEDVERIFSQTKFDAVIHFAGLKAVGVSVAKHLHYFNNNLVGTIDLYKIMAKYGCKKKLKPKREQR